MINEFSREGMPVSIVGTLLQKLRMFLGHYDLRVYVTETNFIDVGRGSMDALQRIDYLSFGSHSAPGCIGRIGQFCNFSQSCELFGGGEHRNNQPINIVFANVPAFVAMATKHRIDAFKLAEHEPFVIGNGAVISAGVKVLPGAKIGDGALIAAGGVVAGEVPDFSIAGGVPAKHIKYRLDNETRAAMSAIRWWDFDAVYMGNNLDTLQNLAADATAKHVYREKTPAFILKIVRPKEANMEAQILGFIQDGEQKPLSAAPSRVLDYVKQLSGSGPYRWVPDIWNAD